MRSHQSFWLQINLSSNTNFPGVVFQIQGPRHWYFQYPEQFFHLPVGCFNVDDPFSVSTAHQGSWLSCKIGKTESIGDQFLLQKQDHNRCEHVAEDFPIYTGPVPFGKWKQTAVVLCILENRLDIYPFDIAV